MTREKELTRERERERERFGICVPSTHTPITLAYIAHSPQHAIHYTRVVLVGSLQYPPASHHPAESGCDIGSLRAFTVERRASQAWLLALALVLAFVHKVEPRLT